MTRAAPESPTGVALPGPDDPVERIKGIGPRTSESLAAVGIRRVVDLLMHLPRRYEDRASVVSVAEAVAGAADERPVAVRGRLTVTSSRFVRRRMHLTDGRIEDDTGALAVRWFNQPWIADRLSGGIDAVTAGTIRRDRTGRYALINPEIEAAGPASMDAAIVPIYPRIGPLGGRRLRRVMASAVGCLDGLEDPLPAPLRVELALPTLADSLRHLHRPAAPDRPHDRARLVSELNRAATPAHRRLAFDELLTVAAVAAGTRARRLEQTAAVIRPPGGFVGSAASVFSFELTAAQRRAIEEILDDLARPAPMARLLQGDVGSGKTAVAILAMIASAVAGRQAALMAPTELLAEQLHRTVARCMEPLGHRVRLLTGTLSPADRRVVLGDVASGEIDVLVGTHALFQEDVAYRDLALVVIDEQHRFGVAQRQRLLDKGRSPHLLVMTATPIPRSLALTVYGDLDLTIVDELPPGRRPVRTEVRDPSARERILSFLRSEIADGGQGFVVCPVIDPSSRVEAVSLVEHEATIRRALEGVEVGLLHGRLDREERDTVAERFRRGELGAILATTVVEVGVDVPAASVMVVENADRFGLSQLHQLRGRVGRGSRQSWCILITGDHPSEAAKRRLRVLERSTDGFEIAEADLRHRGPGELTGLRQWGAESFRFADLFRDRAMVAQTRSLARRLEDEGRLSAIRDELLRVHRFGAELSIG